MLFRSHLATHSETLSEIRNRLAANRLTAPLFDTTLFTRRIEAAYTQAYDRYFAGQDPADIFVEP